MMRCEKLIRKNKKTKKKRISFQCFNNRSMYENTSRIEQNRNFTVIVVNELTNVRRRSSLEKIKKHRNIISPK